MHPAQRIWKKSAQFFSWQVFIWLSAVFLFGRPWPFCLLDIRFLYTKMNNLCCIYSKLINWREENYVRRKSEKWKDWGKRREDRPRWRRLRVSYIREGEGRRKGWKRQREGERGREGGNEGRGGEWGKRGEKAKSEFNILEGLKGVCLSVLSPVKFFNLHSRNALRLFHLKSSGRTD